MLLVLLGCARDVLVAAPIEPASSFTAPASRRVTVVTVSTVSLVEDGPYCPDLLVEDEEIRLPPCE